MSGEILEASFSELNKYHQRRVRLNRIATSLGLTPFLTRDNMVEVRSEDGDLPSGIIPGRKIPQLDLSQFPEGSREHIIGRVFNVAAGGPRRR